jgi:hypothetical protein
VAAREGSTDLNLRGSLALDQSLLPFALHVLMNRRRIGCRVLTIGEGLKLAPQASLFWRYEGHVSAGSSPVLVPYALADVHHPILLKLDGPPHTVLTLVIDIIPQRICTPPLGTLPCRALQGSGCSCQVGHAEHRGPFTECLRTPA